MYDEGHYLEQYCATCRDETHQRVTEEQALALCLQCGAGNAVETEDHRIDALMRRVREDAEASLDRLRQVVVPQA